MAKTSPRLQKQYFSTVSKGQLVLIPVPIAEGALHTLPPEIGHYTESVRHYFVEDLRTARRFLRSLHATLVIDELTFSVIDKHHGPDKGLLKQWLQQGHTVGVMSESGCPGIADPGAELVAVAHTLGAKVIPLVGPSSILLALMASGLNGQSFAFNGYLPVKEPQRGQRIRQLEQLSAKERQTQIFIETPYRNAPLLDDLLKHCQKNTRLCIARNVTDPEQSILTRTIAEWAASKPVLTKVPTVFLLLA